MKILVAEDDHDDFDLFVEAVRVIDPAITCIRANDGTQALSILKNMLPDLLFLDMNMPLMSGKECIERIKMNAGLKDLPIVIHSTTIRPEEIKFFESLDVKILVKDYSMERMVASLKAILRLFGE